MVWLIALPAWVIFWSFFLSKSSKFRISAKQYMIICSLGLIFIMGLRSRYSGSTDTFVYSQMFEIAKNYNLLGFLKYKTVFDGFLLLSEGGFYICIWILARIFSSAQWLIFVSATFIVYATAKFIYQNSEDFETSWIVFICLGSMTFAMNGMRQAIAMSICLLSYRYVKENKLFRFLFVVLIAMLFHKSAIVFTLVYLMRNIKFEFKSLFFVMSLCTFFLVFAQRFAFLYDNLTGEDYAAGESFESGGVTTIIIYLVAIVGLLIFYNNNRNSKNILPLVFIFVGVSFYFGRFIAIQIYERISYYFSYFLMLGFPLILKDMKPNMRESMRIVFIVASVALFAYRIRSGTFVSFELFF